MGCKSCGGPRTPRKTQTVQKRTYGGHSRICDECSKGKTDCETVEVKKWTSFPLYNQAELPEDLDLIGGSASEGLAWRIPAERFMPGGEYTKFQYDTAVDVTAIDIQRSEVIPVRRDNASEGITMAIADSWDNAAQFLAVANPGERDAAGHAKYVTLQTSGFLTFPRTHGYTIGKTYYTSNEHAGEVTSLKPTTGIVQPLFTVVDELTLNINVKLGE